MKKKKVAPYIDNIAELGLENRFEEIRFAIHLRSPSTDLSHFVFNYLYTI